MEPPSAMPLPNPLMCLGALLLVLVGCLRGPIDRWASAYINSPSTGGMAKAQFRMLQKRNQEGRQMWVSGVFLVVASIVAGQQHLVAREMVLGALVVLPCALLTVPISVHARYGAVIQVLLHAWLAARLLLPNEVAPGESRRGHFLIAVSHFVWSEVSLTSLSMLLFNHILTNTVVLAFHDLPATPSKFPLLSVLMIAYFCYVRARPSQATPASMKVDDLSGLTSRCAQLVGLVLEGGDELCEDSEATLKEVIALLTGQPWAPAVDGKHVAGEDGLSSTAAGKGTGSGVLDDIPSYERALVEQTIATEWSVADLWEFCNTDSEAPGAASNVAAPSPVASAQASGPPSPPCDRSLLYAEEMLQIAFDAMAQVDLSTGHVIWGNTAFDELASIVGGGNRGMGLSSLQARLLGELSVQLQLLEHTFVSESSVTGIYSASKLVGPAGCQRVLWVLRQSVPGASPAQLPASLAAAPSPPEAGPSRSEDESAQWSRASDCPDPQAKVLLPQDGVGRRRKQMQMLWRNYGKKALYGNDASTPSTVDRMYYKCYHSGCKARLKIDVVRETGHHVCVDATGERTKVAACVTGTGVHAHLLQLAQEK